MAVGETSKRVAVAVVGIPVAILAVYAGGWVLAVLLSLISALAALELFRMAERKGALPLRGSGAAAAAGYVLMTAWLLDVPQLGTALWVYTSLVALMVAAAAIWMRGVEGQPLLSTAVTLFGAVYTGGLLTYGLLLRHLPRIDGAWHGAAILLAPVVLTWASDTFAYFVGRSFGKNKLIPKVSPGKTVEGSLGALVGTVGVAIGYAEVLDRFSTYDVSILEAALLGVLVSVAAQVGDLAESLLKRDAGVKDSGTLLPGHGGALDRFDSLFFTLPLGYLFFRFVVGA